MLKRSLAAVLLALLAFPALGAAQSLTAGTWTGSVTPTDEEPLAITYEVQVAGDSINITIHTPDRGSYPVENARYQADTLTFSFQPGFKAQCSLSKRDDDSLSGECVSEGGMTAILTMIPPKKE